MDKTTIGKGEQKMKHECEGLQAAKGIRIDADGWTSVGYDPSNLAFYHLPHCPFCGVSLGNRAGLEDVREAAVVPELPTRLVELHPPYSGAVWTKWIRGAGIGGPGEGCASTGQETVSHKMRTYYQFSSHQPDLQSQVVALCWTIPDDFKAWAEQNAILIRYRTESGTYLNSHVSIDIYRSGQDSDICSTLDSANTEWSAIAFSECILDSWIPGEVIEIYLHLASRNNHYARVGSIRFKYIAERG